jgi:hypothetical protein
MGQGMPVLQSCTLAGLVRGSHNTLGALRASLHWTVRVCSPSPHDTEHCTQHANTFILIPSKGSRKLQNYCTRKCVIRRTSCGEMPILGAFAQLQKATLSSGMPARLPAFTPVYIYVCLPVRLHGTTRLSLHGFS